MKQDDTHFWLTLFSEVRRTLAHRIVVSLFLLAMFWLGVRKLMKLGGAGVSTSLVMAAGWLVNGVVFVTVSGVLLWLIWRPKVPLAQTRAPESTRDSGGVDGGTRR